MSDGKYSGNAAAGDMLTRDLGDETAAYDRLPPRVRAALQQGYEKFDSIEIRQALDRGVTVDQVVDSIEKFNADRRNGKI